MSEPQILGFIGTGVMGEPMCRNLAANLRSLCESVLLQAARKGQTIVDFG